MYARQDSANSAIEEWKKAIELVPRFAVVYFDLASIFRQQENYAEAIKYLKRAKDFFAGDFHIYKELAKLYEDHNEIDEAVNHYQEAIKHINIKDPFPKSLYECRIDRLRGRYEEAIGCFQKLT